MMTCTQHTLSAVLIVVMLCPVAWVYGGSNKQSRALKSSMPSVSVRQGTDQAVVDEPPEMTALDASTCTPWAWDNRQQAQTLFARLKERAIAIQSTFYQMLGRANPAQRDKLISHCRLFFDCVDTKEIPNTSCLTSMIHTKQQITSFLSYNDDVVIRVARTPALRSLTSLFNRRGFPQAEEDTQAFIEWEIWWKTCGNRRSLNRDLLRIFSSMYSGKGLPDKKAVEDYLRWDIWWRGEGKARILDRELLRTFSAIFSGKGLPDKKAMEEYLQLQIWWLGEGRTRVLDRTLLRSFSSMFHGRGLPDKKAMEDYLKLDIWWQSDGEARTLNRELLRAFASMFHGKGLPPKKAIEDYLLWKIWWKGEGETRTLDRELLRTFASMFHSKGFPVQKNVEGCLQWQKWWQGEDRACTLDRNMLCAVSALLIGKGSPHKLRTDEALSWLGWERSWDRQAIKVIAKLYCDVPDCNKLRQAEQNLMALIPPNPGESQEDKENDIRPLIKIVALYLADDGGTQQLHWTDCEAWLREHPGTPTRKDLLKRLLLTLHYHGGQGVKETVSLIGGKPAATRWFVLDALGSGLPLSEVQYILTAIAPTEWRQYLFFTRELEPTPSAQQWQTIKGYLETLAPVLSNQESRRQFLTLIWPLSASDRERFVQPEAAGRLKLLTDNIECMGDPARSLTTAELRTLFDTYLTDQAGRPADPEQPPASWLETVLKQTSLSEADIRQLYSYRDQLSSDQVVDILLKIDQSVSQGVIQQWQLLFDEKHYQALKADSFGRNASD